MSTQWARRGLANSGSSAPPLRLPTPSITPRAFASATCRSPWTSCCREMAVGEELVHCVSHMADRSCFHPGPVRARAVLSCPEETQVREAIMTKEAEALSATHSNQRGWSSGVFRLIRRRWWSIARIVRRKTDDENASYHARHRRASQPHRRGAEGHRRGDLPHPAPGPGRHLFLP